MADVHGLEGYLTYVPAAANGDGNHVFEEDRIEYLPNALCDANAAGDHDVEEDGLTGDGVSSEIGCQYAVDDEMADVHGLEEYLTYVPAAANGDGNHVFDEDRIEYLPNALGDANAAGDHDVDDVDGLEEYLMYVPVKTVKNLSCIQTTVNGDGDQVFEKNDYNGYETEYSVDDSDVEEDGMVEEFLAGGSFVEVNGMVEVETGWQRYEELDGYENQFLASVVEEEGVQVVANSANDSNLTQWEHSFIT